MGVDLREVLLSVSMCKGGGDTLHGSAKDVNPRSHGHVEWSLRHLLGWVHDHTGQIKLLDKVDGGLEMLVPRNIQETIIQATDNGLEKDECKGSLQDLLVVLVLLERLAQGVDGSIAVSHDVLVNLFADSVDLTLEVLGGNAEATVEVDLVGLNGREDEVRGDRAMLV